MQFIFLSKDFYNDFKGFTEIEQKPTRPYIQIVIKVNGTLFAIPMRSNINHKNAFFTDKKNKCGVDFSKAVVITDNKYIDLSRSPYIRPNEFKALQGKDFEIEKGMLKYINLYKKALKSPDIARNKLLLKYSTLQYFENYL